jgi:hypothetical protein
MKTKLGIAAVLLSMFSAQLASATAAAPDVDPSRYHSGNIVYPAGATPPASDTSATQGPITDSATATTKSASQPAAK